MPDREKVIKEYEDFVNGYECFCTSDDYEYEMHKAVLALLKEQEAVKPVFECEEPTLKIGQFHCGNCHTSFGISRFRFCPFCGRAVKWE